MTAENEDQQILIQFCFILYFIVTLNDTVGLRLVTFQLIDSLLSSFGIN